ncbi:MAG: indolepyruvate ferredoxin oxidoreductase [Desulfobacteraceae bacterium]|nr:MAG: indolepyruvate ferredoxin oxidoreductase [Desulfobacteraceae bacterium]
MQTANRTLAADPYNMIITGVGGQGNVLASRVVGNMLMEKGFRITIGETFGASQRGGSVMSHLRVSGHTDVSPQIPKGNAHLIMSLEPTEALRVLKDYGNQEACVLCNMRPIHAMSVISGETQYPEAAQIKQWIRGLAQKAWFLNATEAAMAMGNPIFGNIMLVGALAATGLLPLDRDSFAKVVARMVPGDKIEQNMTAFDKGAALIGDGD